jgi:hypothetical protein
MEASTMAGGIPVEPEEAYASADDLVAGDLELDGEDVTLPSGRRVRVRGLSRHELMFNGKGTEDSEVIERRNIVSCLVEPRMTLAQVEKWQRNGKAGGDLRYLSEIIRDASGMGQGADKSGLREDGSGPDD